MADLHISFSLDSVWGSLQQCVDLTVPLYKWSKSHVQEGYYGSLKIDAAVRKDCR